MPYQKQIRQATFLLQEYFHTVGDHLCAACDTEHPRPCGCGAGLVHTEHVPSPGSTQGYYVAWECDACGDEGSA